MTLHWIRLLSNESLKRSSDRNHSVHPETYSHLTSVISASLVLGLRAAVQEIGLFIAVTVLPFRKRMMRGAGSVYIGFFREREAIPTSPCFWKLRRGKHHTKTKQRGIVPDVYAKSAISQLCRRLEHFRLAISSRSRASETKQMQCLDLREIRSAPRVQSDRFSSVFVFRPQRLPYSKRVYKLLGSDILRVPRPTSRKVIPLLQTCSWDHNDFSHFKATATPELSYLFAVASDLCLITK